MAKATHILRLPVGKWKKQDGSLQQEYRDIGVLMEMQNGKTGESYFQMKIHLDALNPVLASLAKEMVESGSSNAWAKLQPIERQPRAPQKTQWPDEEPTVVADNDIPF